MSKFQPGERICYIRPDGKVEAGTVVEGNFDYHNRQPVVWALWDKYGPRHKPTWILESNGRYEAEYALVFATKGLQA